jgi:PLP dependent protein
MAEQATSDIGANLAAVEEQIRAACARCGRERDEITLVAVTKTRSVAQILDAYGHGLRDFGENRVEEAEEKRPLFDEAGAAHNVAADPPRWHMIGHVQSRKAATAVAVSDLVHSVDSMRLARRLDRFAGEEQRLLPILLELNVSGEESKYGFSAADDQALDAFIAEIQELEEMEHLAVRGLMTMAPIVPDAELARPVFRRLRDIRDRLRERLPWSDWAELSMGMTDDYAVAIEEGATIIRVGRAVFGPAEY